MICCLALAESGTLKLSMENGGRYQIYVFLTGEYYTPFGEEVSLGKRLFLSHGGIEVFKQNTGYSKLAIF